MTYKFTLSKVHNRSNKRLPAFLDELIPWAKYAPDDIFEPKPEPKKETDVYTSVKLVLGPYKSLLHRKAVMCEILRVLGAFESSWDWNEGRDTNNPSSNTDVTTEAGIFQVSANSMNFDSSLKALVRREAGAIDGVTFQRAMKSNHKLAMEYAARLLRFTIRHNGPVVRHEIDDWLNRKSVEEFQQFLAS